MKNGSMDGNHQLIFFKQHRVLFFQNNISMSQFPIQNYYPILLKLFSLKMIFKITEHGVDKCYWEGGEFIMNEKWNNEREKNDYCSITINNI
jgi:hypothetical protein